MWNVTSATTVSVSKAAYQAPKPASLNWLRSWMGATGEKELPSFTDDIRKLRTAPCPISAFVIFSSNKKGDMSGNLQWLEDEWIKRGDFSILSKNIHTVSTPLALGSGPRSSGLVCGRLGLDRSCPAPSRGS